jgi:hypothetical protein
MSSQSLSHAIYEEQMHIEERELSAFVRAVAELYGPEHAKLSSEYWLDESSLMDSPPRSEIGNRRSVTIAASARLADRLRVPPPERVFPAPMT